MRFAVRIFLWMLSIIVLIVFLKYEKWRRCAEQAKSTEKHERPHTRRKQIFGYNRNLPLVIISGYPGSGLDLMQQVLNKNANIKCNDASSLVSSFISKRKVWTTSESERMRLFHANMPEELIDSAVSSFILEIFVKHEVRPHSRLCNKDADLILHADYLKKLFPRVKLLLMIRDGRAIANSKLNDTSLASHLNVSNEYLLNWNKAMDKMHQICAQLGATSCMPVYFENLIENPHKTVKNVNYFLNIDDNNDYSYESIEYDLSQIWSWQKRLPHFVQNTDKLKQAYMLQKLGYL